MKKILFALFCIAAFSQKAQQWEWVHSLNSTGTVQVQQLVSDINDNIYLSLKVKGSATLNNVSLNAGSYISSYNAGGNLRWIKRFPEIHFMKSHGTNIYVTGGFSGAFNENRLNLVSNGLDDIYLLRLDQNGNVQQLRQFGAGADDVGESLEIDKQENIYLTGKFGGTVAFDNFWVNQRGIHNTYFLCKLNSGFQIQWVQSGESDFISGKSLCIDGSQNLFVEGARPDTCDDFMCHPQDFTCRYNLNGDLISSRTGHGLEGGNLYPREKGFCRQGIWYDTHTSGGQLDSYDENYSYIWEQGLGIGYDYWLYPAIETNDRNLVFSGTYGYANIDSAKVGQTWLKQKGNGDLLVAGIDTSGKFTWLLTAGGRRDEAAYAIAASQRGGYYVVGETGRWWGTGNDTVSFGSHVLYGDGLFLAKIGSRPVNISENYPEAENTLFYPNPTSGEIFLGNVQKNGSPSIRVYNSMGSCILERQNINDDQRLNLSTFSDGIYLVELKSGESSVKRKILLNKSK